MPPEILGGRALWEVTELCKDDSGRLCDLRAGSFSVGLAVKTRF